MKKLIYIVPLILLTAACSTPKTVLTSANGQVAVCGGSVPPSALLYVIQKMEDKECVKLYKKQGFGVVEEEK